MFSGVEWATYENTFRYEGFVIKVGRDHTRKPFDWYYTLTIPNCDDFIDYGASPATAFIRLFCLLIDLQDGQSLDSCLKRHAQSGQDAVLIGSMGRISAFMQSNG